MNKHNDLQDTVADFCLNVKPLSLKTYVTSFNYSSLVQIYSVTSVFGRIHLLPVINNQIILNRVCGVTNTIQVLGNDRLTVR